MAGNGSVTVPPDSTGKIIDCTSLSVGGAIVVRQRIVIADPTASAGFAAVTAGALQVNVQNKVAISGSVAISGTIDKISAAVALAAGAANIGFINNISAPVVLAAGTNNIGFINGISATVNVAGSFAISGTIDKISAPVVLAAGANNIGFIDKISAAVAISTMPNVNVSAMPTINVNPVAISGSVVLAAGVNNIGTLNGISATVNVAGTVAVSGTVPVSIAAAINVSALPAVVLGAGAANIGFINGISAAVAIASLPNVNVSAMPVVNVNPVAISGTVTLAPPTLNAAPAIASASRGPVTVQLSTSAAVVLVAAPGAATFIYVDAIEATNGSTSLGKAQIYEGSATAVGAGNFSQFMAANGGGFSFKFDPPWKISANTALNVRVKPNLSGDSLVTCHFHTGA